MKLDILWDNLVDSNSIIFLLTVLSFVFGFLLGQGKQIIQFEFLGYLGWGIISVLGLTVLIGLIYSLYFTIKESNMAKESMIRAITLWSMEQQGKITFKTKEEIVEKKVGLV